MPPIDKMYLSNHGLSSDTEFDWEDTCVGDFDYGADDWISPFDDEACEEIDDDLLEDDPFFEEA